MSKPEKNKEKELIEEIYKLVKELKEEKQETSVPENIQSFIDFLKSEKGMSFIRIFSQVISLGLLHHRLSDIDDYRYSLCDIEHRLNEL